MFIKAPGDVLDYEWDWSLWLSNSDTISTVEWTVESGLTIGSSTNTATNATVWLSGGSASTTYTVTCQITTTGARVAQNTQNVNIVDL